MIKRMIMRSTELDLGVDGMIILKWIWKKIMGVFGLNRIEIS